MFKVFILTLQYRTKLTLFRCPVLFIYFIKKLELQAVFLYALGADELPVKWCFSQVKGTSEEEITEGMWRFLFLAILKNVARGELVCFFN